MMRINPAVPAVPITITGMGRCASRSITRPTLHGALRYCGENRPPTDSPNSLKNRNIRISASRKLGVARPTKPTVVTA